MSEDITPREMLTLSAQRLLEIESGFRVLKERRLRDLSLDMRVAAQFRSLRPALQEIHEQQEKLQADVDKAELLEGDARAEELREVRERVRELRATVFVVPAPLRRLTRYDLPEARKHDRADDNALGRAGIAAALAPEFFEGIEEEAEL